MNLDKKLSEPIVIDVGRWKEAREVARDYREAVGFMREGFVRLLSHESHNLKLAKSKSNIYGLFLSPANVSGNNVCSHSTAGCRKLCLYTAGHGSRDSVHRGRLWKTNFLAERPELFLALLAHEMGNMGPDAKVRLNGTSDLRWERFAPDLFTMFPDTQFYDYTKWPLGSREVPANYHLTMSASERTTPKDLVDYALAGLATTVVFNVTRKNDLPETWEGIEVIDGDKHDRRWEDRPGVIVGLRAKGKAQGGDGDRFVKEVNTTAGSKS